MLLLISARCLLGATIDSMFGYSTTELIAAAELDLKLLQEELGVLEKDWKVVLKDPRTRRDKTHKWPKNNFGFKCLLKHAGDLKHPALGKIIIFQPRKFTEINEVHV